MEKKTTKIKTYNGFDIEKEVVITHVYKARKNDIVYEARTTQGLINKIDKSFNVYLNKIKEACLDYELCHDRCKIELQTRDGKVCLCDYLSDYDYEPKLIFEICDANEVNYEDIKKICKENNWSYDLEYVRR